MDHHRTYSLKRFYNMQIRKFDLVIYDTIFPNLISGFRFAEFNALLTSFEKVKLIVNPVDYPALSLHTEQHRIDLELLKKTNPTSYAKTFVGTVRDIKNTKLFYCIFLNNIYDCLPYLEKKRINFVFTLYPGGGFDMKNEIALHKLETVLNSRYFKGVIVSQQITQDFIEEKFHCPKDKILNIFGCIVPQNSMHVKRERTLKPGMTIHICFCAARYTPFGADKGYDLFIETAKRLLAKGYDAHFNVIGGFAKDVISIKGLEENFTFYGFKNYEELSPVFLEQDLILSPNRPFVLDEGSFDGFPLGTVVEATLNGVVPVVTDELHQNTVFNENEIIIVKPDAAEVVSKIEDLMQNPELINLISKRSQQKFREIYSEKYQLEKRIQFLKSHIYDSRN